MPIGDGLRLEKDEEDAIGKAIPHDGQEFELLMSILDRLHR